MSLSKLPLEIYDYILSHITPDRHGDASVNVLLSCSEANSLLREAAIRSSTWESHYRARYTHSDPDKEQKRKNGTSYNWRTMYILRRHLDITAMSCLEDIMITPSNRGELGRFMVQELGYDVWDALQLELDHFSVGNDPDFRRTQRFLGRSISRAFWLNCAKSLISRHHAIRTWSQLAQDPSSVSLEDAFNGLSGFFGVSPQEVNAYTTSSASYSMRQPLLLDVREVG
jgi:F-box protein 21